MKNFFIFIFLFSVFQSFGYQRNQEIYYSYSKVFLKNSFLELTFAPDQLGRLASAKIVKNNVELTDSFKLLRYQETPLFYIDTDNFQGVRELFWRQDVSGVSSMKIIEKSANSIIFSSNSYGGSNLAAKKTITLNPNELVINFNTSFTNVGNKLEKISIWLNLQGAPPALPIIPILGKGKVASRGEVNLYSRPFIFTGARGNSFLPPADSWAGFTLKGKDTVWVIECDDLTKAGSHFYSWGNMDNRAPIRTVEPILQEFSLKPGEKSAPIKYRILVFPGLKYINSLCNNTAVHVDLTKSKSLTLHLCNAKNISQEQKIILILMDKNGKNVWQKEWATKPRKAGTIINFTAPLDNIKVEKGTIKIGEKLANIFFNKDNNK